jgi:hypothetical protein
MKTMDDSSLAVCKVVTIQGDRQSRGRGAPEIILTAINMTGEKKGNV